MSLRYGAVCGGGVREGTLLLAQLSAGFQSLPLLPTSKLGPTGDDSRVGGCVCVHSRTLWVSPMNSPEAGSFSHHCNPHRFLQPEVFETLFQHTGTLGSMISLPSVPPSLYTCKCGTTHSTSHFPTQFSSRHLGTSPLCPAAHLHPSYQSR